MTFIEYNDRTMDYAEYIGLSDYVIDFELEDAALSFTKTIFINYQLGISFRLCAIMMFALTMTMQVIPLAQSATKQ